MIEASPMVRTEENRFMIELVSSRGEGWALAARKARSMIRRFCMLGVSRQSGI